MKPARFLILLSSFIAANAFSQTLEEQEKQIAAKNHIKSKTQTDFKYTEGKQAKTGITSSVTTYSQSGEILLINLLDTKGLVIGWEKYTYDANGNRTLFEREGSGSKYKKVTQYDAKNNLLLESGFNGTENFKNEYHYESGKLRNTVYMVNNKIVRKLVYEYSGSTTNVGIYTGGTVLSSKIKMVYDAASNLVEETHLSVDGKETEKKTFKYNTASQLTEEAKTKAGKLFYKITQEYDTKGRLLKISEETLSKAKYAKKIYSFDAAGNLISYQWRRTPDEEFNVKKYTYDTKGVCLTEHTLYPATKFELLSKFEYEYY
jgi:hypothetical protein